MTATWCDMVLRGYVIHKILLRSYQQDQHTARIFNVFNILIDFCAERFQLFEYCSRSCFRQHTIMYNRSLRSCCYVSTAFIRKYQNLFRYNYNTTTIFSKNEPEAIPCVDGRNADGYYKGHLQNLFHKDTYQLYYNSSSKNNTEHVFKGNQMARL